MSIGTSCINKNKQKKTYAFIHSHCTNSKLPPCKICMRLGLWNIIIVIMINDSECEGNWLYIEYHKNVPCVGSKNIKNVKNGNFFRTFRRKLILLFRKKVIGQKWHQKHFYSMFVTFMIQTIYISNKKKLIQITFFWTFNSSSWKIQKKKIFPQNIKQQACFQHG